MRDTIVALLVLAALAACITAGVGCAGDYTPPPDRLEWDTDADGTTDVVVVDADRDGVPDTDPTTGGPVIDRDETERLAASRASDTVEGIAVSIATILGMLGGYPIAGAAVRSTIRTWRQNRNTERTAEAARHALEDVVATVEVGKQRVRRTWRQLREAVESNDLEAVERLIQQGQDQLDAALDAQTPDTQQAVRHVRDRIPNVLEADD
jgi:hypothetical protein